MVGGREKGVYCSEMSFLRGIDERERSMKEGILLCSDKLELGGERGGNVSVFPCGHAYAGLIS